MNRKDLGALLLFVIVPVAVGFLANTVTADGVNTWYRTLARPSFTPPDWLFGPVWTVLYISMGIAAFLVWRTGEHGGDRAATRIALVLFAAQLVANGLWPILFFGLQRLGLAFVEILLLLGLILLTTARFHRHSRAAALLMVPYVLWVGFASVLNYAIWQLNA